MKTKFRSKVFKSDFDHGDITKGEAVDLMVDYLELHSTSEVKIEKHDTYYIVTGWCEKEAKKIK